MQACLSLRKGRDVGLMVSSLAQPQTGRAVGVLWVLGHIHSGPGSIRRPCASPGAQRHNTPGTHLTPLHAASDEFTHYRGPEPQRVYEINLILPGLGSHVSQEWLWLCRTTLTMSRVAWNRVDTFSTAAGCEHGTIRSRNLSATGTCPWKVRLALAADRASPAG